MNSQTCCGVDICPFCAGCVCWHFHWIWRTQKCDYNLTRLVIDAEKSHVTNLGFVCSFFSDFLQVGRHKGRNVTRKTFGLLFLYVSLSLSSLFLSLCHQFDLSKFFLSWSRVDGNIQLRQTKLTKRHFCVISSFLHSCSCSGEHRTIYKLFPFS